MKEILNRHASEVTQEYTTSYAKYVATSRAIVSLVDGLKPVHRRCINSADDLKLYHNKKFLKVAKLEGQTTGDYHPHGGASMTILAQPFKTRYPLFEGQGNWGSPDEPNSVAASRYIETRMTKFCEDFYLESAEYADREDNYDGRLKEVVRYYPPIPGVLLTGASGIAVGLSTNIPPHCISDVCKSMISYIEGNDYLSCMMPETCEESIILTDRKEIEKLYTTGEASIQYRAKTHYESIEGKLALVVDAFPPDYSKKRLETQFILDSVESGKLELRNESSTDIRYVFLSNDKEVLDAVEERLVSSSGYRMYIEHNDKIHLYKLSEIYEDFIASRIIYIDRKYRDLISKIDFDLEYIRVLLELKKDKDYLKSMFDKSPKAVIQDIIEKYDTNESVASKVISSSLSSMMKDNTDKLLEKSKELLLSKERYQSYVDNPIYKLKLDIENLLSEYQHEKRRAIHINNIKDEIALEYRGDSIRTSPTSLFFVATSDNQYELRNATDLLNDQQLSDKILVSADYDYYVLYDSHGLVAVTKELMLKDNKFKSDHLLGIIGTDDLSNVVLRRSHTNRLLNLGDWALRTRSSYVRQVDDGHEIKLEIRPNLK